MGSRTCSGSAAWGSLEPSARLMLAENVWVSRWMCERDHLTRREVVVFEEGMYDDTARRMGYSQHMFLEKASGQSRSSCLTIVAGESENVGGRRERERERERRKRHRG